MPKQEGRKSPRRHNVELTAVPVLIDSQRVEEERIKLETGSRCPECQREVLDSDLGISCDSCSRWFHAVCQYVKEERYERLMAMGSFNWTCVNCDIIARRERRSQNVERRMRIGKFTEAEIDDVQMRVGTSPVSGVARVAGGGGL